MHIGILELELRLPACHSLKEKRQRLRSTIDRLRHGFNLSVAEVDHQDEWQHATVGVAAVSGDRNVVKRLLDEAVNAVEDTLDGEIIGIHQEVLSS